MGCCSRGGPAVPVWPITCNIWYAPGFIIPPVALPTLPAVPCQLVPGELVHMAWIGMQNYIKVPAGTNVHWARGLGGADLIECPAGSAQWWTVQWVTDIAKGFSNEHRLCRVTQVAPFPIPVP